MRIIKILGYKKVIIFVIITLVVIFIGYLYAVSRQNLGMSQQKVSINMLCGDIGGKWLGDYGECEYSTEEWCNQQGGFFKDCESSCRHNSSEDCVKQCVPVCFFNFENKEVADIQSSSSDDGSTEGYNYKNLVILEEPLAESKIMSPLLVEGRARGSWFNEASFPVYLTNWDGLVIAEGIAQAKGDWMTEGFVDFSVTLEFTGPQLYDRASLILKKDNPSGLPENDDAFEVALTFAEAERKTGE